MSRAKKGKWFWIQLAIICLLGGKLALIGLGLSKDWLSGIIRPEVASAQQEEKAEREEQAAEGEGAPEEAKKGEEGQAEEGEGDSKGEKKPAIGPGQMEILRNIELQKQQLETRTREINKRASELNALQKVIDEKMAELQKMRTDFEEQVKVEKARQNQRMKHLVNLYSNMKPKAAAAVIEKMDIDIAVEILRMMKGREAGKILNAVQPEKASRITQLLSNDKK